MIKNSILFTFCLLATIFAIAFPAWVAGKIFPSDSHTILEFMNSDAAEKQAMFVMVSAIIELGIVIFIAYIQAGKKQND